MVKTALAAALLSAFALGVGAAQDPANSDTQRQGQPAARQGQDQPGKSSQNPNGNANPRSPNGNGMASDQSTPPDSGQPSVLTYGTVRAIDTNNRLIALALPDGRTAIARVSDSVSNFEQIEPGEVVVIRYTEPAVISVTKRDVPQQQEQHDMSRPDKAQPQSSQPQASQQQKPQASQQEAQTPERKQQPQASAQQQPQASGQQPQASQRSSDRSGTQGSNTRQDESQPKATIAGEVAGVDRSAGVLVVQSDEGDEVVMRAPDSNALADLDEGDRVLVTYTEAAIVGIQPAEGSEQRLPAQKEGGTSNEMQGQEEDSQGSPSGRRLERQ